MPYSSPFSAMYSMIAPSSGGLPVRSPKPNSVALTASQPYSQAVAALTWTLWKSLCPCHSRRSLGTPTSLVQLVDQLGDAPRQLHAGETHAEAHRVAEADLRRELLRHLLAHPHQPLDEGQHEAVDVGPGDVLQVAARPHAGLECRVHHLADRPSMHSLRLLNFSFWKMW